MKTTYHTVTWEEAPREGGVRVHVQLIHPDDRNRGIEILVPDAYLFEVHPGMHAPLRRLVPADLHGDEDE